MNAVRVISQDIVESSCIERVMGTVIFAIAILSLILMPLAPKLLRLRIRILRWLHWNWAVNLLEKHFDRWVLLIRIILFVIAAVLFYVGWEDLRD